MYRYLYKKAQERYRFNPEGEIRDEFHGDLIIFFIFTLVAGIVLIGQLLN